MKRTLEFFKTAIFDYAHVGAVTPTSKYVARKILAEIPAGAKYIVEYGPGDGAVTREALKKLPPDGKLIAIEINDKLISELKKINDPRLKIIKGDVIDWSKKLNELNLPQIDLVLSNVPMLLFKVADRKTVIGNTYKFLMPGSRYITWQYSLSLKPIIKSVFKNFRYTYELRNLPPYFIMVGEKELHNCENLT